MKKTTLALPEACEHCGNTDRSLWYCDWTRLICKVCDKATPYVVVKVEEV